jgi:F-type H+-transporting ATPase subunit b
VGDIAVFIWTIVIFLLVLWVLRKFAWKPLLEGLQRRERFIHDSLESAKRDRQQAEERLRDYEEQVRKARDEATAIVEEGRRDAESVRRRIEDEARHAADEMIERAKREIGVARDTALRDLYQQASEMAMQMAGEVLKRQMTPEDHEKLIQDALEQLKGKPFKQN